MVDTLVPWLSTVISTSRCSVLLDGETDVAGFRAAVRSLIAQGVAPGRVDWRIANATAGDLFTADPAPWAPAPMAAPLRLPAFFVNLCGLAALHADPCRHGLLYRLAWRLVHEPTLRHDPLDADRLQMEQMARAVRRDMHKMTAFVRFRPLVPATTPEPDGAPGILHVAWFEPLHHIVEANAPFFVRRFTQMPWTILTPRRSVHWNGRQLSLGPGARRADLPPADAAESLWLTYYENIFNPSRLKLAMMQKEMPRRYWKNLPEAVLIHPLTVHSAQRSGRMIEQTQPCEPGPGEPPEARTRRRPAASWALRLDQRKDVVTTVAAESPDFPGTLASLRQGAMRG